MLLIPVALAPIGYAQKIDRTVVPLQNWSLKKSADATTQAAASTVSTSTLLFVATTPCRVMDTRAGSGMPAGFGAPSLAAMTPRKVVMPGSNCGLPVAAAYSLNVVSVTNPGVPVGWVSAWSGDVETWPGTAIMNAVQGGIVGSPAVVSAGADGGIYIEASNNTDIVIDVNGYWVPRSSLTYKGVWNAGSTYAPGDVVTQSASGATATYIAIASTTGTSPQADVAATATAWNLLSSSGPAGPSGPAGAAGSAGPAGVAGPAGPTQVVLTSNVTAAAPPIPFYLPLTGSGNPTAGTNTLTAQASVMPVACTLQRVSVFNSVNSGTAITVQLARAVGGVGAADLGISLAAAPGAANSANVSIAIAAGDTLTYTVTPAGAGAVSATLSLLCQ